MCLGLFTCRRKRSGVTEPVTPGARPVYLTKNTSSSTISSSSKSEKSSSAKGTTPPQSPIVKETYILENDPIFQKRLAKARIAVAMQHQGPRRWRGNRHHREPMDFAPEDIWGGWGGGDWGGGGWGGGGGGDGGGGGGC